MHNPKLTTQSNVSIKITIQANKQITAITNTLKQNQLNQKPAELQNKATTITKTQTAYSKHKTKLNN